MKRLISLARVLKSGLVSLFRNAWLSTAATTVMAVTLTILLAGFAVNTALNNTIEQIASKFQISIYLEDGITDEQRRQLQSQIANQENVKDVAFVSKAEAERRYFEQFGDNPELVEGFRELDDPLPASLEIELFDLNNVEPVVAIAEAEEYAPVVQETSYDERRRVTIDRIAGASNFVVTASILGSGIFAFISALIIFNTIRMAIFARGDEIGIMRLIGATNGFIRGPFLVEAAIYGIIAAGVALAVVYSGLNALVPRISSFIDFNSVLVFLNTNWLLIAAATVSVGVLIGIISSALAMIRHLKL